MPEMTWSGAVARRLERHGLAAPLVAGQAYFIRVDFRDSATNANNATCRAIPNDEVEVRGRAWVIAAASRSTTRLSMELSAVSRRVELSVAQLVRRTQTSRFWTIRIAAGR